MKRLLMAACIASLAACGADTEEYDVAKKYEQEWEQLKASLVYSFPANQQQEVPTPSPIVLQFSSDVTDSAVDIESALEVREVGGAALPISVSFANDKTVIVEIDGELDGLTEYEVDVPAIALEVGTAAARTIAFKTKGLPEGPRSEVAGDTFEIIRTIPDGSNYPVVDFATFRVQFSAPIDASTVSYGDSVSLTGPSGLVDAHVIVDGPYLTVDPKDDLTPGENYTLTVSETVQSDMGDALGAGGALSLAMVPKDTGPRETLINDVAGNGMNSPLTGRDINMIPMASTLLGEDTATQSEGVFPTEVAYAVNFPEVTPLRIPRGTLLEAAEIDVLIGGAVDAGFDSGDVGVTFISDATGYMIPNPYSDSDDAPRNIHLFMDVGIGTNNPEANGSINQNLLHIELVGTAIVLDGALTINAVGVAEPEVMGSERAESLLSFYMKAFDDQDNAPQPIDDTTPPQLVSWTPGDEVDDSFNTTDSILFVFDEPVSVDPSDVVLTENGTEVDATVSVDGTTLVIKPAQPLKHGRESDTTPGDIAEEYAYEVTFAGDVSDLQGNAAIGLAETYQFALPVEGTLVNYIETNPGSIAHEELVNEIREIEKRSPVVLSVYPGYPCIYDEASMNLAGGVLGQCQSGLKEAYESPTLWLNSGSSYSTYSPIVSGVQFVSRQADDQIHVPELPANRPIVVQFSKTIDPQSVVLGSTFSVVKVDAATEAVIEAVDGNVSVQGKMITFWPDEPWAVGETYRYTVASNGDTLDPALDPDVDPNVDLEAAIISATPAVCDGTQSICDTEGLPVQTMLVDHRRVDVTGTYTPQNAEFPIGEMLVEVAVDPEAGGPDMVQYFVGAEESSTVLQTMAAPSQDRNANFWAERNYPNKMSDGGDLRRLIYAVEEVDDVPSEAIPDACTDAQTCDDPSGVMPKPNTSKLLSTRGHADIMEVMITLESGAQVAAQGTAINIGCGYDRAGPDYATMAGPLPTVCPENKFAYLNSSLIAEVGAYDHGEQAVPVSIWPGQIMVSSIPVVANGLMQLQIGMESGPQRIRMRYAKTDPSCVDAPGAPCERSQPITAWLRETVDGPILEATVDAYLDALRLEDFLDMRPVLAGAWRHELVSVPMTLELSGSVEFLEDGRMVVNQMNTNAIEIYGNAMNEHWSPTNWPDMWMLQAVLDFTIPEQGTYMQYISTPIK